MLYRADANARRYRESEEANVNVKQRKQMTMMAGQISELKEEVSTLITENNKLRVKMRNELRR